MLKSLTLASLFILFSSTAAQTAAFGDCSGDLDNQADFDKYTSLAVPLTGNFRLTNKKTGQNLAFVRDDSEPMFAFVETTLEALLGTLTGSEPVADDVWALEDLNDQYGATRIANAAQNKCASTQWSFVDFCDRFFVPYQCSIGSTGVPGTLEDGKQRLLFIPLDGPGKGNNDRMVKVKRDDKMVKRGPQDGTYGMVLVDHLLDMTTKGVSGRLVQGFAQTGAMFIDDYDETDESFQWIVTQVHGQGNNDN